MRDWLIRIVTEQVFERGQKRIGTRFLQWLNNKILFFSYWQILPRTYKINHVKPEAVLEGFHCIVNMQITAWEMVFNMEGSEEKKCVGWMEEKIIPAAGLVFSISWELLNPPSEVISVLVNGWTINLYFRTLFT